VFVLGVGFAVNAPACASLVPQLVTGEQLPSALPKPGCDSGRTLISFLRSIAIPVRYVGQTPNVRNILLRNAIFSSLVVVIPALMPVVLLKDLGLDGSLLGLVFASMGVGSVLAAVFVIPWLRSRFATDQLMMIAQITLACIYVLMATVHHCLYCLVPMTLTGASWTLAASELWVAVQRTIPNFARGRISALMMVLSQYVPRRCPCRFSDMSAFQLSFPAERAQIHAVIVSSLNPPRRSEICARTRRSNLS
jgi:Transmembrane secretion effector